MEKAICTHCRYHEHTVDKCYKLYGYLSGYKPKQRFNPSQTNFNAKLTGVSQFSDASHGNPQEIQGFMQSLSPGQYQHLLNMLNSHLIMAKTIKSDNSIGQVSVISHSISSNALFNPKYWILDSRATSHICVNKSSFVELRPIQNASFIFPNHTQISIEFISIVKPSPHIILDNDLYVP